MFDVSSVGNEVLVIHQLSKGMNHEEHVKYGTDGSFLSATVSRKVLALCLLGGYNL